MWPGFEKFLIYLSALTRIEPNELSGDVYLANENKKGSVLERDKFMDSR
jgi:hypothetical protein